MPKYPYMQLLPQLKDFLRTKGFIYTVRDYEALETIEVMVLNVGICRRVYMGVVDNYGDLQLCIEFSGFKTVEEWIKKLRWSNQNGKTMYLYKLELVREFQKKEIL